MTDQTDVTRNAAVSDALLGRRASDLRQAGALAEARADEAAAILEDPTADELQALSDLYELAMHELREAFEAAITTAHVAFRGDSRSEA